MRLLMRGHLLLMTWLLWLQVWRDTGAQTVCPYNETLCDVDADMTNIYRMRCGGYGVLEQLPPACTETRVISNLVIREFTTVYTLQHRILDGLRVRQLELTGLGIRSIVVSAFEAISSDIEVLYLQDNQLESLPLGVFRTLRYLTRLQLHNNQLTQLSEASFDGLTNLVYLTLNLNRISVVEQRTWYKMPALTTLVLENNLLGNGRLIFPYMALQRLEELRLDNNRLREINADITFGVPNLRRLSFRSNSVESLPYRVFHATPRLQVVDLSANNISELTRDSFDGKCMIYSNALHGGTKSKLPGFRHICCVEYCPIFKTFHWHIHWRIQTPQLEGGQLSPLFSSPSFLSLPPPLRPFRSRPLKYRSGERCKLPQRGLRRSPSRNRIWCISALKSDILWHQFYYFYGQTV